MDANTAFDLEVKQHRSAGGGGHHDLFHVVAHMAERWWTGCRVEQANALKSDKPARKVVKSAVGCCYVIGRS